MSIRSDVEYYFDNHPNEKIYLATLVTELGYEPDQLKSAVYWVSKNREGYEVIHQGQCWIYKPTGETNNNSMSIVAVTPKGSRICEDSDGTLWIARKFEE